MAIYILYHFYFVNGISLWFKEADLNYFRLVVDCSVG